MASFSTTENNTLSLKDLIGEIIVSHSDEPTETYSAEDFLVNEVNETDDTFEIFEIATGLWHYIYKRDTHVEVHPDRVDVYNKQYFCTLTQSFIRANNLCNVSDKTIVSKYKFSPYRSLYGDQFNAKIISTPCCSFVFNIVDVRTKILAFLMSMNVRQSLGQCFLAPEVFDNCILPHFDGVKVEYEKRQDKMINNLHREYNGEFPEFMSLEQVKRLYELGMIKMIKRVSSEITVGSQYERFGVLSDDAFDNDPEGAVKKIFETKENMHVYIQEKLHEEVEEFDINSFF